MDAQALTDYIRQGVRQEVCPDRVELYLPFWFGNENSDPLCLVFSDKGVLSDGGRTLAELKNRLGDIAPYQGRIQNILSSLGPVKLEGGHILTVPHFQTLLTDGKEMIDYMGGLNRMLRAISLISIVDTILVDEGGAVTLC